MLCKVLPEIFIYTWHELNITVAHKLLQHCTWVQVSVREGQYITEYGMQV